MLCWVLAVSVAASPAPTPSPSAASAPAADSEWMAEDIRTRALAGSRAEVFRYLTRNAFIRSWGNITLLTPEGRLRMAAVSAKEKYMELSPAEIAAVWTPTVEVHAIPDSPAKITSRVVNVEHIVMLTPGGPVQPLQKRELKKSASNAYGASVTWVGMAATFPLDVLREGNTLHVILDQVVNVHDEAGLAPEEARPRSKDDSVPLSEKFLGRLRQDIAASPAPAMVK